MNTTIVFVTHDMDEAIKIADRIIIMKDGDIVQYDTPEEILKHPKNEFVQEFIGKNKIWDAPEYIKVEDIMITTPIVCSPDLTKNECVKKMVQHHIDTLIVVDEDGRYIGIVIVKDYTAQCFHGQTAKDMVNENAITASPDESILELLQYIEETDVTNIPVVDNNGYLKGLITSSSLISVLSSPYLDEYESGKEDEA